MLNDPANLRNLANVGMPDPYLGDNISYNASTNTFSGTLNTTGNSEVGNDGCHYYANTGDNGGIEGSGNSLVPYNSACSGSAPGSDPNSATGNPITYNPNTGFSGGPINVHQVLNMTNTSRAVPGTYTYQPDGQCISITYNGAPAGKVCE